MLTDATQPSVVQPLLKLGRFLRPSVASRDEGTTGRGAGCRSGKGTHCLDHGGLVPCTPSLDLT